jgi:hypothetical protein
LKCQMHTRYSFGVIVVFIVLGGGNLNYTALYSGDL